MNNVAPVDGKDYFGLRPQAPKSELTMENFLKLLTTQLANQNPLEPMNDRDFFAQMAQLGSVQGLEKMTNSLNGNSANAMIGKGVIAVRPMSEATNGQESLVVGIVESVVMKNGVRYLSVREKTGGLVEIKPENIQQTYNVPVDTGTTDLQQMLNYASSANLVGKHVVSLHPTLKDANGNAVSLEGKVKKVTFEGGSISLIVVDQLGKDVKIRLQDVQSFSTGGAADGGIDPK